MTGKADVWKTLPDGDLVGKIWCILQNHLFNSRVVDMRSFLAFVALFLSAACDLPVSDPSSMAFAPTKAEVAEAPGQCGSPSSPACRFLNSPVKLEKAPVRLPHRALVFYPTAQRLDFLDGNKIRWVAPPKTLTDGASIPKMFVSIVGSPTSPEFVNAAAVHDAYCGVGNENGPNFQTVEWWKVHRMFYEALRVGGTPQIKAKVMYAAVFLGGPRWEISKFEKREGGAGRGASAGRGKGAGGISPAKSMPQDKLRQIMRQTKAFVETENPPLSEIDDFVENSVRQSVRQLKQSGGAHGAHDEHQSETGFTDPSIGLN